MLGKKALFPGEDYVVQMKLMFEFLGCPEQKDLAFIDLKNAKTWANEYIRVNKDRIHPIPLERRFPRADRGCLKLLSESLMINPLKRITVEKALESPFFEKNRKKDWEKSCPLPFEFKYEDDAQLTARESRHAILKEVAYFRPDILQEKNLLEGGDDEEDTNEKSRGSRAYDVNATPKETKDGSHV